MDKEMQKSSPNVAYITDSLARTFPTRRLWVTSLNPSVAEIVEKYPALKCGTFLQQEFTAATGCTIEDKLLEGLSNSSLRILEAARKKRHLAAFFDDLDGRAAGVDAGPENDVLTMAALYVLPCLVKERSLTFLHPDDPAELPPYPTVDYEGDFYQAASFIVSVDELRIEEATLLGAISTMMAMYWVFNMEFLPKSSKTLQLLSHMVPSTRTEWKQIAEKYEDLWQFPDCVGALDGKHVAPMPPHDSGAQFRNYKGFFSIVLMALVDADLNFVFVDVGRNGRMNDSGIWGACKLKEALEKEPTILPDAQVLPRSTQAAPYVIVGDEGFGLKPYLMRPHPAAELTTEKRLFNYRLSRARRTSENAFGVFANRWQIYRSPLRHDPERATDIVLATVALHNFLRSKRTTRQLYTPSESLDVEDILTGNVRSGSWRQGVSPAGAMRQFRRGGRNCSDYAKAVRNLYTNYFVNEGQVRWQWQMIT
ncbi:uncharacterized protein LOC115316675 [Ixodes scapularis]|uniref:uncharacterized protein LOC115316675 n=1 Tax=Ixodes scapularis TaxID=6945 RepID=UPI001C38C308|nr:uncharacterized protein LOC115316675 [Ixodes scapularis]